MQTVHVVRYCCVIEVWFNCVWVVIRKSCCVRSNYNSYLFKGDRRATWFLVKLLYPTFDWTRCVSRGIVMWMSRGLIKLIYELFVLSDLNTVESSPKQNLCSSCVPVSFKIWVARGIRTKLSVIVRTRLTAQLVERFLKDIKIKLQTHPTI